MWVEEKNSKRVRWSRCIKCNKRIFEAYELVKRIFAKIGMACILLPRQVHNLDQIECIVGKTPHESTQVLKVWLFVSLFVSRSNQI
jgi:hypothetical protein